MDSNTRDLLCFHVARLVKEENRVQPYSDALLFQKIKEIIPAGGARFSQHDVRIARILLKIPGNLNRVSFNYDSLEIPHISKFSTAIENEKEEEAPESGIPNNITLFPGKRTFGKVLNFAKAYSANKGK
ncbi:hypothetical protein ACFL35_21390 [Candidatus Riflebacteria bacterium]